MFCDDIFRLLRKKGILVTLEILYRYRNNILKEDCFFKELKNIENIASFYRVKEELLLKYKLIEYRIEQDSSKRIISLTNAGLKLYETILDSNALLIKQLNEVFV